MARVDEANRVIVLEGEDNDAYLALKMAAVRRRYPSIVCPCSHVSMMHGPLGCEGLNDELTPCDCKARA